MKKAVFAAAAVLAAAGVLIGSRGHEEEISAAAGIDTSAFIMPGMRVAVVSKNTNGQFWDLVRSGMEDLVAAVNEAYGFEKDDKITLTYEGPDNEQKVEEQINILDAVIAENPSVLCISVGDMDSCQAQLEAAAENGIPVVAFDSNVSDATLVRAFCGTDNRKVGEMAALRMGEALSGQGQVAVFSVQEKTESARERTGGFAEALAEYPDIEIVETVYQDQVEDLGTVIQETLQRHPGLDGVFCSNADVAEIYLDTDKGEGAEDIVMIGVDATTRQQEALRNGEELCIISQDPRGIGRETAWTALLVAGPGGDKADVDENMLFEPVEINLDNLEDSLFESYIYK